MMPPAKLARMVFANTLRSPKHFVLSAFGIVIGIATFVLFLASTEQVGAVLEKMFPLEEVEVIAPQVSVLGKDASKRLDADTVKIIEGRPEVAKALPRMALAFPAYGSGTFEGQGLALEIGGAADGVDASFVKGDTTQPATDRQRLDELFRDWEAPENRQNPVRCTSVRPIDPKVDYENPCPQPDRYYCDAVDLTCHHRVPVVLSPTMLELYNTQYAKSHGTPIVTQDFAAFMIQRGGLARMRFDLDLGVSVFGNDGLASNRRRVEAVLIGISPKAKRIGLTMPIQYISRWNTEFKNELAGKTYSSIIVTVKDQTQIGVFGQWLQNDLDLRLEDSLGEKFATVLFVIRFVLVAISLIIIIISAINIAHNFFMQVTERRRELGLLRAVGATRADVTFVVLGEAALVGIIGGLLGLGLGVGLGAGVDWISAHYVPSFPFKPATWFHFRPWIVMSGLGCAAGFAVLGGYLPARRAANMEPATALTQN